MNRAENLYERKRRVNMRKIFLVGKGTLLLCAVMCAPLPAMAQGGELVSDGAKRVAPKNLGDPIGTLSLPSPAGDAFGLADAGSNLFWHAGYTTTNRVYLVNANGVTVRSFDASANASEPGGVTTDGTFLYVADANNTQVDIYDLDGVFQSSFGVVGTPHGITYNPNTGNLYIVQFSSSTVVEYTTAGALVDTFPLVGAATTYRGIEFDPQRNGYWIVDDVSRIVELYNLDFTVVRQSFAIAPADTGVAVKGNKLYITERGASQALIFDITEFQLAVPFFLDNGGNLVGSMPPSGVASFVGVKNMSAKSITLTITYTSDTGQDFTPVSNTIVLGPNQALSWRPGADDPAEGGGQAVPNKSGGFPAGSVLITADGPITGRLVELDGDNQVRSAYTLPKP
jgi:hypothetical protein